MKVHGLVGSIVSNLAYKSLYLKEAKLPGGVGIYHREADNRILVSVDEYRLRNSYGCRNGFTDKVRRMIIEKLTSHIPGLTEERILFVVQYGERRCAWYPNTIRVYKSAAYYVWSRGYERAVGHKVAPGFRDEYSIATMIQESKRKYYDETQDPIVNRDYPFIITILLIFALWAVYLKGYVGDAAAPLLGLCAKDVLEDGETYRLLSYMFVHTNLMHLIQNTLILFYFGAYLESKVGFINMAATFLGGGVFGALASIINYTYIQGTPERMTVGASGAIYAVVGAALVIYLYDARNYTIWVAVVLGAIGVPAFLYGNVDTGCHVGGMLFGHVFGLILIVSQIHRWHVFLDRNVEERELRAQKIGELRDNAYTLVRSYSQAKKAQAENETQKTNCH